MKERLQAADYRFIAVCLALLAGATWYSARNFYRAFPEASIDFRVSRAEALQRAESFLAGQGHRVGAYRDASSFDFDDDAKTFLEREAGLENANRLMGTRVRLWRWQFRWFRPEQVEEFRTDITPEGDFAGFQHKIPEDAARPALTAEQALNVAENFLRRELHRDPASLDFVDSSTVTRPRRVDRTFTWKERDFEIHGATNRLSVTLLGDEVGGYSEYLKVPEQWTRDYQKLRSRNNEAQTFDTVALLGLMIGVLVVLVTRVRRQDVRWRRAAVVGILGMALSFLSSLNEFPLAEFGYGTTDSYGSFVAQHLMQALLAALGWGGALFVITAGAEVMYREALPGKVSLGCLFSFRGLRTKRFFLGAILGVTLCAIFIAYQTIFYIVAYKYGAWSPADVPYSDLLNTKFPFLFVLFGGYLPAISEEFLFRMFAIPFLRKLVRWMPAAVVLAGFIWGFGHAGYPQQPFFIRGLEVGIGGIALGCIMLRWGILPTLVWHYSVDAMYSAMLLLRSHSLYFKLSGAASAGIFVLPILAALVAYWRYGGFEPVEGLLNGDEQHAVEPPPELPSEAAPVVTAYRRLSLPMRVAAGAVFIIGVVAALMPTYSGFGESPNYRLSADEARQAADTFLKGLSIDPGKYRHVTYAQVHWGGDDSLAAKYFLEHGSLRAASNLFERYRPVQHWATRYFQSLEKEEILVTVQPETGRVIGFHHQIPEDRPGADLSPDAARQLAAAFAAARGINVDDLELKENESEKRKARRDYSLVWEARPGDRRNVQDAHYRVAVDVDGDQPASLRTFWKVPETFERNRDRQNTVSLLVVALKVGTIVGCIVFGLAMLTPRIKPGLIPWRRTLRLAILPTAMTAIAGALSLHLNVYRGYQTYIPFDSYLFTTGAVLVIQLAFAYLLYCAAAAFLLSFWPESLAFLRRPQRRSMGLDAGLLLLMAIGLSLICHQVAAWATERFHAAALLEIGPPTLIGIPAPIVAAIAHCIRMLFSRAAILGLLALVVARLPRRRLLIPALLVGVFATVTSDIRTWPEFALEYGTGLIAVACAVGFCFWFARNNYLAYGLILAVLSIEPAIAELLRSGNPGLQVQAGVVAVFLLAFLMWAIAPALQATTKT